MRVLKLLTHFGISVLLVSGVASITFARPHQDSGRALFQAIDKDDVRRVGSLLAHGADANATIKKHLPKDVNYCLLHTALMEAAEQGDAKIAILLLAHGANPNAVENCFMYAKMETDTKGRTALIIAADQGHLEVVRVLLQHGAAVNALMVVDDMWDIDSGRRQESALSCAQANGHKDVVDLLLAHGAKPVPVGPPTP
jgi:ankyrin repeat protein